MSLQKDTLRGQPFDPRTVGALHNSHYPGATFKQGPSRRQVPGELLSRRWQVGTVDEQLGKPREERGVDFFLRRSAGSQVR